jgi:succinate dehydrogenase/fumarate reductase flavoprotein subunit
MRLDLPRNPDVVVVGAGAAGLVAAATAAAEGASVAVLERADVPGGTATHSVGEFWIPDNHHLRAHGIVDPRADCLRFMAQLSYPDAFSADSPTLGLAAPQLELLETFYDRAAEAVLYLERIGALRSRISPAAYGDALGHPEYYAEHPDNRVRQGRHLIVDDGDPGFGLRGKAYVSQLVRYLERMNVEIRLRHRAVDVSIEPDGRVSGVVVEGDDGVFTQRARNAVIFATGGFGHDAQARAAYLPAPIDGVAAVTTNTGDFLRIGMSIGTGLANMTAAYLGNAVLEVALTEPRLPALLHFPYGDSMIWVDRTGRRVVNEKAVFTQRAKAHFAWDVGGYRHSRRVLIQVYDHDVARQPAARAPVPQPGGEHKEVLEGQTWPELAAAIDARLAELESRTGGIRLAPEFADNLAGSVAEFNGFAKAGHDAGFRRGETAIETCYETPLHEGYPNAAMAPFRDRGPYYAVLICAAMFDTAGGPSVNPSAQVLDVMGEPVPGLYGAGCCIASPGGQAYWSGGAPIGLALTFGYIAGVNAARDERPIDNRWDAVPGPWG